MKNIIEINNLYKKTPALYQIEDSWEGFEWIVSDDRDNNFIAFKRMDRDGGEVVVVLNFSGVERLNYRLGVNEGKYKVLLSSDAKRFGGEEKFTQRVFNSVKKSANGKASSITLNINKFSGIYLQKIK